MNENPNYIWEFLKHLLEEIPKERKRNEKPIIKNGLADPDFDGKTIEEHLK